VIRVRVRVRIRVRERNKQNTDSCRRPRRGLTRLVDDVKWKATNGVHMHVIEQG